MTDTTRYSDGKKMGEWVKALIARRAARLALEDALSDNSKTQTYYDDPARRLEYVMLAIRWVDSSLDELKATADNPFGNNDEAIAQWLVGQIDGTQ